jgi:hypothetical protein
VQIVVVFNAFHCIPVRSTNKIASIASRSGTRGRWHPNGCVGAAGNNLTTRLHSQSGIRQPSSLETRPIESSLVDFSNELGLRRNRLRPS